MVALFQALFRLLGIAEALREVDDIVSVIDSFFDPRESSEHSSAIWSASDYTAAPERDGMDDDDSVFRTPNEDELDDPEGDNAYDMPLDTEGDGDVATGNADILDDDSTEEATDEDEERLNETDEDEESDEDEEDEESVQDEEDYEDESDLEGGWEGEEEIAADDLDDDLDYNEDEGEVDSELDEQGDGGYRISPEDEENAEELFAMLAEDSADTDDAESGEEVTELEDDDLIAGSDLFNSETDSQDDFLDWITPDAEFSPFDAALLTGETEMFDSASNLFDDMLGDALQNYFASEEL